ncbi:uncharacterized protein L3040_002921 [Drepanopeziza brunnea f. sp. 'multigermtubi']|uniref:B-related factor 1 n=1 Tax=Marssonina brunnea f. sp. multigermtubi (strain MB_m1) TaxID=1072389 RepID=K1WJV4_MARBU|nr:Brf1-like TBP-binding domain-containing protein [Drepanopeziza brunnea f. sp. 'multigermtubi' MB_m1]EKD13121.1 Brf1-like TBP-binding domain-containing protein [Drepanopeziza brunnea f. sp. 'multigermtubi' MB_m1]KAJ5047078.1 hypothetical protein L3040_002921 [Drepanopeziza brunnea f. sp. 'multigermtubi']
MAPPKKPKKVNPLRNRVPIKDAPPTLVRQATAGAAARAKAAALPPRRPACPNKECHDPDIQDGICHNCGFVVDDSNIVSEITFGENSAGGAVVQGSFVSADQGGARTIGPGFKRGGGDNRENTLREGRNAIQGMGAQLGIRESTIQNGVQIFKLAAMNNFIQGRRMEQVAAVCLYSACRKDSPCRIMLIDFADLVQTNVFKLGYTFKKLHDTIAIAKAGIQPVLPEDLIFRFAQKLEFGNQMTKVAEDAVRMVQRMSLDWMVMGRRPSGVCGACLILAARMNNFRRTITEVVYIVKVTTHTIQKRLEEFKQTPSSALTVEDFLNNEFLETCHDPPSYYEKTEAFLKTKKRRKRKAAHDAAEDSGDENEGTESATPDPKRRKTAGTEAAGADSEMPGAPSDTPASSPQASASETLSGPQATAPSTQQITSAPATSQSADPEVRRDAEGFVIPPLPVQSHDRLIDPELIESQIADKTETTLEQLALLDEEAAAAAAEASHEASSKSGVIVPGLRSNSKSIYVPDNWSASEQEMEDQISEMISDPDAVARAEEAVRDHEEKMRLAGRRPNVDPDANACRDATPSRDETPSQYASPNRDPTPNRVESNASEYSPSPEPEPRESYGEEIMAPNSGEEHATLFAEASKRAAEHLKAFWKANPPKGISVDAIIGEDEFAGDPEVEYCMLSAADTAKKEKVWSNDNKSWLRAQQVKDWAKKNAAKGPQKAKRTRKPKPRIGEGQTSAASSPGEAAVAALKERAFSKKINYDAINSMFAGISKLKDKDALGSAATSRLTSRAGSVVSELSDAESTMSGVAGSVAGSEMDVDDGTGIALVGNAHIPKRSRRKPGPHLKPGPKAGYKKASAPEPEPEPEIDEEDGDDDDYIKPTSAPAEDDDENDAVDDWRSNLKKSQKAQAAGDEEEEYEDNEVYDDLGGIDAGGVGDFDDTNFGDGTGYGEYEDEPWAGGDFD